MSVRPSPPARSEVPSRRADARRNHERVFEAALEVFQEHGLQGTVPQIAARAGVGKATVYRSYPSKEDLVEAAVQHRLAELRRRLASAVTGVEPREAFGTYALRLFESLARDRLLSEALAGAESSDAVGLLQWLTELLEEAKAAALVRPDVTVLDLRVVLCGVVLQLATFAERDSALWRRYARLTLQALRP
ncbi:TetR family transcriptional regulator [Streptomyces tendae]|uniref:TetR/AcrR family transcriptional regulator n=1 Tax=Streptomyces tendae TaxID=1932 RepID=UPI0016734D22|nr:TetR/AcrR family transcriptional regulator [Streptomyces tendae]GHB11158.1 TetR family transcriptional regulator [Streptomyces tendae]